jgi:hypothetical protein
MCENRALAITKLLQLELGPRLEPTLQRVLLDIELSAIVPANEQEEHLNRARTRLELLRQSQELRAKEGERQFPKEPTPEDRERADGKDWRREPWDSRASILKEAAAALAQVKP